MIGQIKIQVGQVNKTLKVNIKIGAIKSRKINSKQTDQALKSKQGLILIMQWREVDWVSIIKIRSHQCLNFRTKALWTIINIESQTPPKKKYVVNLQMLRHSYKSSKLKRVDWTNSRIKLPLKQMWWSLTIFNCLKYHNNKHLVQTTTLNRPPPNRNNHQLIRREANRRLRQHLKREQKTWRRRQRPWMRATRRRTLCTIQNQKQISIPKMIQLKIKRLKPSYLMKFKNKERKHHKKAKNNKLA